jgi:hypothetical protein
VNCLADFQLFLETYKDVKLGDSKLWSYKNSPNSKKSNFNAS